MMAVSLTNDGPVTMLFDSKDRNPRKSGASSAAGSASTSVAGSRASTPAPLSKEEQAVIAKRKVAERAEKKAAYLARVAAGELPPPKHKTAARVEGQELESAE
jgi:hypothetical protein